MLLVRVLREFSIRLVTVWTTRPSHSFINRRRYPQYPQGVKLYETDQPNARLLTEVHNYKLFRASSLHMLSFPITVHSLSTH